MEPYVAGERLSLGDADPWARAARDELAQLPARDAWIELLALPADAARPAKKWLAAARSCVERIGPGAFAETVRRWFALVTPPRAAERGPAPGPWHSPALAGANGDALKALVWACSTLGDESLAGAIGDLAVRCFTKIRGVGALSMKVGNACIYTLWQLPGLRAVAQLSRLAARVRYKQALALVDRAKLECARRAGMDPIDLEELAVPTFGIPARVELGGYSAELAIDGAAAELVLYAGDRRLKTIPAEVKQDHREALGELRASHKELAALLPALRARLERWMLEPRRWSLPELRTRYLDHPVVGSLARRLIFTTGSTSVVFGDDGATDAAGARVALPDDAILELWHPLGRPVAEVRAWRERLDALAVTQPFKQAHREIYLLTDAERQTGIYSNRFAAHLLRQHQFAALCRERGWTYTLQGQWDSHNTPTRHVAAYDLDVQFWVEAGGDVPVSETFVYLYVATDQVRFVRGGMPLRLEEVPPRCFSELLRDVDLFVGVCSIGADPAWRDHGPQGTFGYWDQYAFGDLGASGETRKAALERLLPRLKIRDRAQIAGRFLVVRGQLRTYKIHLGSGNILMEPNDQYLCIVPERARLTDVKLPFEGDQLLSVILSKALLLAADDKIKDPGITRQIGARA